MKGKNMIKYENYSIEEIDNKLIIFLPQTIYTSTNTIEPLENRKIKLSSEELATILLMVKKMYEREERI